MPGSVDRLAQVLGVGMRLRQELAAPPAASTGVRWNNGKVVSVSKEERALLTQLTPNESDVPADPPSLRQMWRYVHNNRSQGDPMPLAGAGSSAPEEMAGNGMDDDDGMASSDDDRSPRPSKAPKRLRVRVLHDDDSSDSGFEEEPASPMSPDPSPDPRSKEGWAANYQSRKAQEAKKAAEAAEAERAALAERYRLAAEAVQARAAEEEAARARAAADVEATRAAAAAAAAEAEAEAEGEEEGEDLEELDEPDLAQNTVTVQEAWDAFKPAWDAIDRAQAVAWLTNMTDAEANEMFPIVAEFRDAVAKGDQIKGTIKVGFFRIQKKEISGPMMQAVPSCGALLRQQQHFLFCEPDALQAGANKFSELFKSISKPAQWALSAKSVRGYSGHAHKAQWQNCGGHGKGVYFFNCTFVTHKPTAFRAPGEDPNCRLEKVMPNWVLCYRWLKAAEVANAALAARFGGVSPTIAKFNGPQDKTTGPIGYDTPLVVPNWAKVLFPKAASWSDSNFPSIVVEQRRGGPERRIRFGRGGQSCKAAAAVLAKVVELDPVTFGRIFTTQLEKRHPANVAAFMADDTKTVALASWSNHARTVYKDVEKKAVIVYDPWKQSIRAPGWFTAPIEAAGYRVEFVAREAEQAQEGSCQLQATMRVLIGAIYGREGIEASVVAVKKDESGKNEVFTNPHLQIFPVITQMLYSKFKPKAEKSLTFRRR